MLEFLLWILGIIATYFVGGLLYFIWFKPRKKPEIVIAFSDHLDAPDKKTGYAIECWARTHGFNFSIREYEEDNCVA